MRDAAVPGDHQRCLGHQRRQVERRGLARHRGVLAASTPFVAFSDDDSWWAPGALPQAERLFLGSPRLALIAARTLVEEELLATELAARGWFLSYAPDVLVHHEPSSRRESRVRRRDGIRNTLWTTWLRRPVSSALRRTAWLAGSVSRDKTSAAAFLIALRCLPWVLRERRVIPAVVEANLRPLEAPQRNSTARRYVG